MKLFVKLRESGKVIQVSRYDRNMSTGKYEVNLTHNADDCDLCDEQGRLLVPEQPDMAQAVKLLQDLADLQNGAPLEQHKAEWEEVMEQVYQFLNNPNTK